MLISKRVIGTIAYMGGVFAIPEPFCWSWSQMIQYNNDYLVSPGEQIFYDRAQASYHSFARNTLVNRMQGDWLLMMDTDHKFDPDIAARLLRIFEDEDLDVLSGMYQYRSEPYSPVMYSKWTKDKRFVEPLGAWDVPEMEQAANYLVPVVSAGAGCLLVRRRVFDRIKNELKQNPFDIIHPYSEDHSFFKRLSKLKIKSFVVPQIESNHLTFIPVTLDMYNKDNVKLGKKVRT